MKTWDEYIEQAKRNDSRTKRDIEEMEELAQIISIMIDRRKELGISQRELAEMCEMPQSSVARMEKVKTVPNLYTLLTVFNHLGLRLTVTCK